MYLFQQLGEHTAYPVSEVVVKIYMKRSQISILKKEN